MFVDQDIYQKAIQTDIMNANHDEDLENSFIASNKDTQIESQSNIHRKSNPYLLS